MQPYTNLQGDLDPYNLEELRELLEDEDGNPDPSRSYTESVNLSQETSRSPACPWPRREIRPLDPRGFVRIHRPNGIVNLNC